MELDLSPREIFATNPRSRIQSSHSNSPFSHRVTPINGATIMMKKTLKAAFFFATLAASVWNVCGQLDLIDPTFNPEAYFYGTKRVRQLEALPDGKVLALGNFSSYNRGPVGKLIRLNSNGSLDTTFNNQTVTGIDNTGANSKIVVQPDGKILLASGEIVAGGQPPKIMIRLNADGTLDPSFNYSLSILPRQILIDSLGRIIITGNISTPQGTRRIVRLSGDGTIDNAFSFTGSAADSVAVQGNKLMVGNGNARIYRINENGTEDPSFAPALTTGMSLNGLLVQQDNKVLYLIERFRRLNENGGADTSFESPQLSLNGDPVTKLAPDGKIVAVGRSSVAVFRRFLTNGASDPAFIQYAPVGVSDGIFTIQPDGGILIGDVTNLNAIIPLNNFVRLTPDTGSPDPAFNQAGVGFQTILPGSVRAIEPQADGKLLIGGRIDLVNNVPRYRLARLNADATVDLSFQVPTGGTGNRFSIIRDVYQIRTQADGKVIVSGWFDYVQSGVSKRDFVRLNSNGSIDDTFNLTAGLINDYSEIVGAGRNRFLTLDEGKLMVGHSKLNGFGPAGPLKVTATGPLDSLFTSALHASQPNMFVDDVVIQPDGKIVVSGTQGGPAMASFVARLNPDGSMDSSFTYAEEPGRFRSLLAVLPDGKILVAKHSTGGTILGTVRRLNSDGTPDNSFSLLSIPDGVINAILALPNGKIFVGGRFTVTVNGQETKNLLRLDADGNIEPTTYDVNEEVLSLALDGQGRLLVGGRFTVIDTNNGLGANRSYIARLTDSAPFDYDGDGKSDISVFRPSENKWYILRSSNSSLMERVFAVAGDIPTPADYDGDGKTDVAIFRPSSGDWWYFASSNNAQINVRWGQAGDIPRPSDFDGDGKTDFVVYRPGNSVWYRAGTSGTASITAFGIAEDKPLVGDFDGDGKGDLAVFRPSTGDWWYSASASSGQFVQIHWGQSGDIPVPADYDGDGKTDCAVFRPSNGGWYVLRSSNGSFLITAFGTTGDRPTAADYDGDGKADIAVFRPSTGLWYMLQTTAGSGAAQWGIATDVPTESAFIP